jgi:hypothetical protein
MLAHDDNAGARQAPHVIAHGGLVHAQRDRDVAPRAARLELDGEQDALASPRPQRSTTMKRRPRETALGQRLDTQDAAHANASAPGT